MPQPPPWSGDEELGHRVFGRRGPVHHREARALLAVQDRQDLRPDIAEPAQQLVRRPVPDLAQSRKQARGGRGQVGEVIREHALDPLAVIPGGATVTETDLMHRSRFQANSKARQTGLLRPARAFPPELSAPGLIARSVLSGLRRELRLRGRGRRRGRGGRSRRRGGIGSRSGRGRGGAVSGRAGGCRRSRRGGRRSSGIRAAAASREHQCRRQSAKSKLCIHRWVPRRLKKRARLVTFNPMAETPANPRRGIL